MAKRVQIDRWVLSCSEGNYRHWCGMRHQGELADSSQQLSELNCTASTFAETTAA